MAVAFRTVAIATNDDTTITVNKPTGTVEGDLLIGAIVVDNAVTITPPANWTLIQGGGVNPVSNTPSHGVWYKVAGGSEPADYTWSLSEGEGACGAILRYDGQNVANPINASGHDESTGSTTPQAPTVTTDVDGCMIVRLAGMDSNETPYTSPDGYDERVNHTSTEYCGQVIADLIQESLGATGTADFAQQDSVPWYCFTVAIAPAVAAVDVTIEPPLATVDGAGLTPILSLGLTVSPPLATVAGVGLVPTLSLGMTLLPPLATADVVGLTPTIIIPSVTIYPPLGTIAAVGLVPTLNLDCIFGAPLGIIEAIGLTPVIYYEMVILPPLGTIDAVGLAPTIVIPFVYLVKIDWNKDGDYSDAEENISAVVFGFKIDRGRDQAWELGKSRASVAEILVDNVSKKYSPENSESPIYGNVKPGRPVRIVALEDGVTYPLFIGTLENFKLRPQKDQRTILFYAEDGLTQMRTQKVYTAVYENITTGVAIGHILDAIGWDAGKRIIDTGQTTLLYWWAWDKSALQAIRELEAVELGLFYLDEEGNAVYEDRHHRLKGAHLTSQETYDTDNRIYHDFKYDMGIRNIFNQAIANILKYSEGGITVLWTLDETPCLAAGEVRTWRALFTGGAVDLVTPVESTDYIANSESGGGGDDLSANISISITKLSQGADLEVTNNGAVAAYLTTLQQRGKLLSSVTSSYKADNVASQTDFEIRTYPLSSSIIPTEPIAKDYCDFVVSRYGIQVPTIKLKIWNATAADLAEILARRTSDRVTIKNDELGLDDEFFIHNIKHVISKQGRLHEMEIACERASPELYWVLGTSRLDTETKLAY